MVRLVLLCVLLSSFASAQTRPMGLPRFADPPEANGANQALYENGLIYNTTLACTQRSDGSTWKCLSTAEELAQAVATLNARIDTVSGLVEPERRCTGVSLSGVSIPLAGVSSPSTTVSVPGVPAGASCSVGPPSLTPAGATAKVAVSPAGTATLRFDSGGGPLGSPITMPSGWYRICCDSVTP